MIAKGHTVMPDKLRWGILATARIARKFIAGVRASEHGQVVAVGSRSQATADAFGEELDIPRRHGSYQALADDANVDAIYVATPHPMHKDATILCLQAGKAVLCEKPFAVNAAQAAEAVAVARERKVFCMEAMWSRFLPSVRKAKEIVDSGRLGELRMIMADFGFRTGWNPEGRLLKPELAGGGLLDVGIYPISLAGMFLGEAREIASLAHIGETGVDEQAGIVIKYDGGRIASMTTGVRIHTPMEAWLLGTEAKIHLHHAWWRGGKLTVLKDQHEQETIDPPMVGNGYNYEADEVARCLAAGKLESDAIPLDETLSLMRTLDAIRAQWGLTYPFE